MTEHYSPPIEPLSDDDLEGAISVQIEGSTGFLGDELSTRRSQLFSAYARHGYTDDALAREEDRSDSVDSTCSDSVDNILGEMLETLMGSEHIASFVPNGADDMESAAQETDAVHNIFFTQNRGYLILQNWLWDGLVLINGYVKAFRDERFTVETHTYTGQTTDSIQAVIADLESDGADVEVVFEEQEETSVTVTQFDLQSSHNLQLEAEEADVVTENPDGTLTLTSISLSYRLKIKRKKGSYKVLPVPTDEILVSPMWDSVDLEGCPFVGHRYLSTESDLLARGFNEDQIRNLPSAEDSGLGAERHVRFDGYGFSENDAGSSVDDASRQVLVVECWFRADRDGDGIAELLMAVVSGADGKLLEYEDGSVAVEEVEEIPIHSWTPFIIPHRHYGESVVERNMQIQRTKTVFQRQLSDTTAFSANPRMILGKGGIGPDTVDDAQVYRPGGLIRADDAAQVLPVKLPSSAGDILPLLDYWSDRNEERTGATRLNQGLVSDKFGKQVAGVTIAQLRQAGMAKTNMIVRNFIETGFASLMRHLHALVRRHQDKEMMLQIRGQWVPVDPTNWGDRSEVEPGIGLGNQGRMVKTEVLREVIGRQAEAMAQGSPITDQSKLYNALSDFMTVSGFRDADRYFTDPATLPPPKPKPPAPDPSQQLAEAQLQISQTEADTRLRGIIQREAADLRTHDLKERELTLKEAELRLKDDRERDKAVLDALGKMDARITALAAREVVSPPAVEKPVLSSDQQ